MPLLITDEVSFVFEVGPTLLRLEEQGKNFARFVNVAPSADAKVRLPIKETSTAW